MKYLPKTTILFIAVFFLTFSTYVKADEVKPESGQESHSVVTGDTLWDISGGYYKDSFLWPILWSRNPDIKNPHLIYPEENVNLMPLDQGPRVIEKIVIKEVIKEVIVEIIEEEEEVAVVEEVKEEIKKVVEPPKEPTIADLVDANVLASAGYFTFTKPETFAKVEGGLEGMLLLEKGSLAYINKGSDDGLKVGDRFTVVTYDKEQKSYSDLSATGFVIKVRGECVVSEVLSDRRSVINITEDFAEINKGDILVPEFTIDGTAKINIDVPDIENMRVIAAKDNNVLMGKKNIVYLNKGAEQGLKPGHMFSVFRKEYLGKHVKFEGATTRFPQEKVGELTVVYTTNDTATAVITGSKKNVFISDKDVLVTDRVRKTDKIIYKR